MTVLVSVPTFGVGTELLEKSVRSVLAQTHTDLVCVVVGDGEHPPLPRITDSRIRRLGRP
jgi:glycosyltransferase involved in cell wall biosynthesis